MRKYFIKTPWLLKKMYPSRIWDIDTSAKNIYLTFDDGPDPVATPFVLELLKKYNAKATFFCIGKNVVTFPEIYKRILAEGHSVGNHTYNHLNGWKTKKNIYLNDIAKASSQIESNLFRPPYGRLTTAQANDVTNAMHDTSAKIIMWDVLSGDFDTATSKEKCLRNVIDNTVAGSIIVFHDSTKAFEKLQYALPAALDFFIKAGYDCSNIKL